MLFNNNKMTTRKLRQRRKKKDRITKLLIISIVLCLLLLFLGIYFYHAFFNSEITKPQTYPDNNNNNDTTSPSNQDEFRLGSFYKRIGGIYDDLSRVTDRGLEVISPDFNEEISQPFNDTMEAILHHSLESIGHLEHMVYFMGIDKTNFDSICGFLDAYVALIRVYRFISLMDESNQSIEITFNENYRVNEVIEITKGIFINILIGSKILNPLFTAQAKIIDLYGDELQKYTKNTQNKEAYERVILRIEEAMVVTADKLFTKRNIRIYNNSQKCVHNGECGDSNIDYGKKAEDKAPVIKEVFLIQSNHILKKIVLLSLYPIYVLMFEFKEDKKDSIQKQLILRKEFREHIINGVASKCQEEEGRHIKLTESKLYSEVVQGLEDKCSDVFAEYLIETTIMIQNLNPIV